MKLRIYLDTSVPSAYFDARTPDRQEDTRAFWARRDEFEIATSDLTRDEILSTPDPVRRAELEGLLEGATFHPITSEMVELADAYVAAGVFAPSMLDDARHVAAAVLTGQNVVVSWNFRHLVNRSRRAHVNQVNAARGLPSIEILAPPEL